ncbi:MAG: cation:dicarboxylase symporter family transporter [Vicinamibacterales bacterium]
MSLATRVLVGLVCGGLLGLALAGSGAPAAATAIGAFAALGGLFVDLIRMCAMPLVAALVVASLGRAAGGGAGRAGVRAAVLAVAVLTATTAASLLVAHPLLAGVGPDPGAIAAAADRAAAPSAPPPGFWQWVRDLVPQNVAKAASDGAMLPVIVFAVLFGLAVARSAPARRDAVLGVAEGVAEAMQHLVSGVLRLAPVGVFALAVPLTARTGLATAGAVATYIVVVVALTALAIAALYPLVAALGRMPIRVFAACAWPAQAVAVASRSSLATLPVLVEAAERARFEPTAARVVLPLAVSIFHVGTAVAQTVGVLFLARLAGVALGPVDLGTVAVAVVVASSAVPGIPGGSIIAIVPVLTAAHVPLDGIGLLLAVDTIPDMVRTVANVTGAFALAAMTRTAGTPGQGTTPVD